MLVVRRPPDGLLGGLWEFPWVEVAPDACRGAADAMVHVASGHVIGVDVVVDGRLPDVSHVFSHLEWRLRVFAFDVAHAGRREAAVGPDILPRRAAARSTSEVDPRADLHGPARQELRTWLSAGPIGASPTRGWPGQMGRPGVR